MKRMMSLLLGLAAAVVAVADAAPSGAVSDPMALDIESGVRSEEVVGELAYDTLWQGVTNADYRILVNGVVLSTGSGAGIVAWHPTKYGTYALAYQAFVDNVKVGEDMSFPDIMARVP